MKNWEAKENIFFIKLNILRHDHIIKKSSNLYDLSTKKIIYYNYQYAASRNNTSMWQSGFTALVKR